MFGKPAFGAPAPATSFGGTGLFGQTASTGGGLFNTSSTFGQQNKPTTFGFGTTGQSSSFLGSQQPQTSSIFNTSGTGSSLFGGATAFSGQQQSGTTIKFVPVTGTDTMMRNGTAQGISTKHHSITCMKEYEGKSFEELRMEDYQANRKGPQQGATGFGGTAFGTGASAAPSLFGQTDANKSAFGQNSAFGQTLGQTPAFGQQATGFGAAPAFGAATSTTPSLFSQTDANKQSAFGQSTFGQTSAFGQGTNTAFGLGAQQNATASPFGKPAFGAATSGTSFGFGSAAPQNANPFGSAPANKPFGTGLQNQAQPLLFGNATSQPNTGFGTGLFSNTQNTTGGLFNKPAQPATGFGAAGQTSGFSFNTPASTQPSLFTNAAKPLFGGATSTTPAFGATNTFGTASTGFGSTFGKPAAPAFGQTQTSGIGTFSSGFGTNNTFGTGGTTGFNSSFGKPAAPGFGQTQMSGLGNFNSGGLGSTTTTGLFGNQNQAKPGGLFGGGSNSLFGGGTSAFGQQNTFGLSQPTQQQTSLLSQPEQNPSNIALLTSDPFGDAPHLAGLEPKLKSSTASMSTTDPKELKSLLDASKKIDLSHNARLKVTPFKSARDSLFDTIPRPSDSQSPLPNYQKPNVRRLVLKPRPSTESGLGLSSANILDILTGEDKENRNSEGTGSGGKVKPVKLTFDSTEHNESFLNHSVETQTFNALHSTGKDQLPDHSLRDSPPPPSDDDDDEVINNNQGGGDTSRKHPSSIICTRPEYYTLPSLEELTPDEDGKCFVRGFTVGRKGYGNVYFPDEIDVAGLNLDELVHFCYREINVYPDESKKPPVGQGLNRRAQITLDNVYPRRVGSNTLIKDVGELIQMNFAEKLRKVTEKKNARFVDYRPETGSWVFKVDHFSKYGFNESDDENDQNGTDQAQKGLQKSEAQKQATKLGLTKESLEERSIDQEMLSKEPIEPQHDVPPSRLFGLDKDILVNGEEQQENDVLHHSMMMDDASDEDYQVLHDPLDMDMHHFKSSYPRNVNVSNIQYMKMALFDDDRSSDGAQSHSSILKQYLDIPEMDEIPRLPTLTEEVIPRRRVLVRPKIWKVLNNYQLPKATSTILPNRCCVDVGMFKGKSFKPSWLKGFNFYSIENGEREFNHELLLKSIDTSPVFDPLKDILTDSLKVVLDESECHLSPSKVPTFKIKKSEVYLKRQTEIFERLATQYNSAQTNYLHSIWTLCTALWGPGENSVANRRHLVSEWLKYTCINDNLLLKNGPFEAVKEATESIFTHLSIFKVDDAANLAMDARLPNLCLLLAQLSLPNRTKAFMQEQNEIWYKSMAANHISIEFKRLYLLLAGMPTKDGVNIFEGIDWKRAFGMHLWFICPNGAPIDTSVHYYEKAFKESQYAQRPNPPYLNTATDDGPFDVLYHILQLYKSGIHRLSSTLDPTTHTDDPLDYRLSWLLLQLFLSLDIGLLESSEMIKFCTSFSTQLEHLGYWEWAVFVLLYLEDDPVKTKLIMGILDRNLSVDYGDMDESTLEIVDLLVNHMKIPPEWIHTVKGYKTMSMGKHFEAFNHFSLAEEYVTANDIFINHLLPNLFINEQYDVIRNLSDKVKPGSKVILHWRNGAGLILDYLDLLEESITTENLVKLQMKLGSLSERIVYFPLVSVQQKVCVAELSKRCASLYRELCNKSQSDRLKEAYGHFSETLVMPPDFKLTDGLYLIQDFNSVTIGNAA